MTHARTPRYYVYGGIVLMARHVLTGRRPQPLRRAKLVAALPRSADFLGPPLSSFPASSSLIILPHLPFNIIESSSAWTQTRAAAMPIIDPSRTHIGRTFSFPTISAATPLDWMLECVQEGFASDLRSACIEWRRLAEPIKTRTLAEL